jgi:DivIVA domain-containing protein
MAPSPQRIRDTNFKAARKGYDPAEVDAFVEEVAAALETAQNEATAMEARARAAVARLQELSREGAVDASPTAAAQPADITAHVDEAETISRTLLLAQRTADTTIAEAQAEADRVLGSARDDANSNLDTARAEAARLVEEARADARKAGEGERVQVEGEVQALLARRDFLESDVDHLEQYLLAQRERLVEVAATLTDLVQKVPGGLADMRRPLLSAAAEPGPEAVEGTEEAGLDELDAEIAEAELIEPSADGPADAGPGDDIDEQDEIAEITRIANEGEPSESSSERTMRLGRQDATPPSGSLFDDERDTQQIAAVNPRDRRLD